MGALFQAFICLGYVVVIVVVILLTCVDLDGDTRVSAAARFCAEFPERVVWPTLKRVCGAGAARRAKRWSVWLCEEPNPVLQSLYLGLVVGGYGLVVAVAYPRVPGPSLAAYHKALAACSFASCLLSFAAASATEPGYVVDARSVALHDGYAYDGVLFVAGRICPSAKVRKVARSKFCVASNRIVARVDHFCPWLNIAVGE